MKSYLFFKSNIIAIVAVAGIIMPAEAALNLLAANTSQSEKASAHSKNETSVKAHVVLKFFHAGQYRLADGESELCGEGEFRLRDHGRNVELGPLHGYDLKNQTGSMKGDSEGDESCLYRFENKLSGSETEETLEFTEVRACKTVEMHKLHETTQFFKDGTIGLASSQTGEGDLTYNCKWTPIKN